MYSDESKVYYSDECLGISGWSVNLLAFVVELLPAISDETLAHSFLTVAPLLTISMWSILFLRGFQFAELRAEEEVGLHVGYYAIIASWIFSVGTRGVTRE